MAAGQTIHKQRQVKRTNNRLKNEQLRAKGQHPKQLRAKAQEERANVNKALGRRHGQKVDIQTARQAEEIYGVKFRPSMIRDGVRRGEDKDVADLRESVKK